jgi:hypothetical protein
MFSSSLAKTFPLASHARQVLGVSVGSTIDGPCNVARRVGAHPRVVILSFGRRAGGELLRRLLVGVVGVGGFSALLDLLVAFEVECLGHGDGAAGRGSMASRRK